jgi:hypothetical protein
MYIAPIGPVAACLALQRQAFELLGVSHRLGVA